MRDATSRTRALVEDGKLLDGWYVADLMYDDDRRLAGVPFTKPSLNWQGDAQVSGSGSATVIWSDAFGRSMVPQRIGDVFSPFGAELQIDMMVGAGSSMERIPMGRFVIAAVPAATRQVLERAVGGLPISIGERIDLRLKDALLRVQRDKFPFPTGPATTSMWGELQSLTGLPVIRNTFDVTIPRTVAYDDDKLNALDDLLAVVDAVPHLTPTGAFTSRPKTWPAPVDEFRGVASAPHTMDSDKTYNRVVVEGKSPTGAAIYGKADVTTGYLRVANSDGTRSPFGVATYRYASEFLTTIAQCNATAAAMLPRVAKLRSVTREVVEPLNPLREVGDVVLLEGGETRILSIEHSSSTTRSIVEVAE